MIIEDYPQEQINSLAEEIAKEISEKADVDFYDIRSQLGYHEIKVKTLGGKNEKDNLKRRY